MVYKKAIVLMMIGVLALTASTAAAQSQNPVDLSNVSVPASGPSDQRPAWVDKFTSTSPLTDSDITGLGNLSGKIRAEDSELGNITVDVNQNDSAAVELLINSTNENATNVTFYIQQQAVASTLGVNTSDIQLFVSGNQSPFHSVASGNNNWLGFAVPHFSEQTVTFQATGSGGGNIIDSILNGETSIPFVGNVSNIVIIIVFVIVFAIAGAVWAYRKP